MGQSIRKQRRDAWRQIAKARRARGDTEGARRASRAASELDKGKIRGYGGHRAWPPTW